MNAKQWLGRARGIDREIDALLKEKQETRDRLTKITQSYENDGAQMTQDPHKFDRLVELENLIDLKVDELIEVKIETRAVISKLRNRFQRMALTGYYLSGKTWEQVAVDMNYSFQNVMKLRKQALREVEKLLNI